MSQQQGDDFGSTTQVAAEKLFTKGNVIIVRLTFACASEHTLITGSTETASSFATERRRTLFVWTGAVDQVAGICR